MGHIMRCLTLAEALRDSGKTVEFICRDHVGNMIDHIKNHGFKVHSLPVPTEFDSKSNLDEYEKWLGVRQETDAAETIQVLADAPADLLIIDHYALDQVWEKKLRPFSKKIMVIDDLANRAHDCDILLDQNYINEQKRYDHLVSPDTIKLFGPKYALLRKDFIGNHQRTELKDKKLKSIFVFFGGSDSDNLTTTSLKALLQPDLEHLSVDVVIGSTNPHQEELKAIVRNKPNVQLHIQVENIAELMAKADIALGAGGSTSWERMAIGLPSIVVTISENQIPLTRDLEKDGYLKWLGNVDQVDENIIHHALLDAIQHTFKLDEQSRKGQELVDGMGIKSITKLLTVGVEPENLLVRRAKASDCLIYWYWANDPDVRENAFNQQAISWEDHCTWFENRLNNPESILFLIECEFGPIGQVRFDYIDLNYMISYSIGKTFRGFGLGKSLLGKAINTLNHEYTNTLIGDVKETNSASIKIFEQLGFSEITPPPQKGVHRFRL